MVIDNDSILAYFAICSFLIFCTLVYFITLDKSLDKSGNRVSFQADIIRIIYDIVFVFIITTLLAFIKIDDSYENIIPKLKVIFNENKFVRLFLIYGIYRIVVDFTTKLIRKLLQIHEKWYSIIDIIGFFILNGILSYTGILDSNMNKVMIFINTIQTLILLHYLLMKSDIMDIRLITNHLMYLFIFISFFISK